MFSSLLISVYMFEVVGISVLINNDNLLIIYHKMLNAYWQKYCYLCYHKSSSDDVDSKRIKKLAKELLALERAYALLQAHVGSAVDAERDEMVIICHVWSSIINLTSYIIYFAVLINIEFLAVLLTEPVFYSYP